MPEVYNKNEKVDIQLIFREFRQITVVDTLLIFRSREPWWTVKRIVTHYEYLLLANKQIIQNSCPICSASTSSISFRSIWKLSGQLFWRYTMNKTRTFRSSWVAGEVALTMFLSYKWKGTKSGGLVGHQIWSYVPSYYKSFTKVIHHYLILMERCSTVLKKQLIYRLNSKFSKYPLISVLRKSWHQRFIK